MVVIYGYLERDDDKVFKFHVSILNFVYRNLISSLPSFLITVYQ